MGRTAEHTEDDREQTLRWGHGALTLELSQPAHGPLAVTRLLAAPCPDDTDGGEHDDAPAGAAAGTDLDAVPLVELLAAGHGRARASMRLVRTAVGARLRLVGSARDRDAAGSHRLRLDLRDTASGLAVWVELTSPDGVAALSSVVTVTNAGAADVLLQSVTSWASRVQPAGAGTGVPADDLVLLDGVSDWVGEGRWQRRPLRAAGLADLSAGAHGGEGRQALVRRSQGTWSTGGPHPLGALSAGDGTTWLWEVASSAGWRWEVGDDAAGAYLALAGPTDDDHAWAQPLAPGESWTSVPAVLAVGADLDAAVAALTRHRRATRRAHPDDTTLPVVFNDYMNTLMGDPTTAKLLPLVDAAADAGAEVFCIDAGWYDDTGDWWDTVGAWEPSTVRFPGGLREVTDHVRARGMVVGLWLEPEVVGVRSPLAGTLPPEAFWQRHGRVLTEHGRHHLDLAHPAARAHLDAVVDRLVGDFGVGFFKLDYNVNPGAGTDRGGVSPGAGLLRHHRAHLDWLTGVLDRHPELVLENCSSGAMRADRALLSVLQLQSTSDQQDPPRYAPVAAAAPLAVLPEQAANWAYPQPGMGAEEVAATLVTGLLSRIYVSGHLPRMDDAQRALVHEAVAAHRALRGDLVEAVPAWPLGLPGWEDPWVALALTGPRSTLLSVWHRGPAGAPARLRLPALRGRDLDVAPVFPVALPRWPWAWDAAAGVLTLEAPAAGYTARCLRLTPA
nr:glycoside hydrolase family 36 protein [Kineococcus siccus]